MDVRAAIPERQAPPPTVEEQMPRRVYIKRSVELVRYGHTDRCIGCQHARLGLKQADHSEECRARIVRHMTADDNLNQRVQIAQDRIVETTAPEARTGERDLVPEPARKKVRFAERVEEQTPEGTVATHSRSTSSSSSSSSSSDFSSSPTAIAPSMQVDESNQDSSKRQKVTHGADMELEGLVMESERDRLQRYSDCDFLMQVKQNADVYSDRFFCNDRRKRENCEERVDTVGCASNSPCGGSVFKSGTCKIDLQHGRPILIVGSWSGHSAGTSHMRWMMDTYRWQVAQGRFFVHQYSGELFRNTEFCAMKSILVSCVDVWRTFITNCEEIHNNLFKVNCRSHVAENCITAMIRGLRQALTRNGCLQAIESGPTMEEPCAAVVADYDHMYYDSVTGASLPSKLCEESRQLEIKYMKEMNVYTLCEHGAMKEQGLTPIGTRWVFTNKGDTEHPFIRARLVVQETKRTTKMDLTDTSITFAATLPVEGFRLPLSRAMTGEKKRNPQDELVIAFFDISRAHFHSPVRRKVSIIMRGDPSCPSGIAMINRAMLQRQCFDSYCQRTMEKLDNNIGVFNPC